jgi:hypothetical protein
VPAPTHLGFLSAANAADVSGLMRQLQRDGGMPELVGSEVVRGEPTEHYRFRFAARAVPEQLVAMGQMRKPTASTIDVWADVAHRLRRIMQRADGSSDHYEAEYFDFGTPVAIEAPPADEVRIEDFSRVTGDWSLAQAGRTGDVSWRVYRAPSADGECFAHEADPPGLFDGLAPKERGRSVDVCSPDGPPLPDGVPFAGDDLNVTATPLANGMALLFGGVGTDVTQLTLHEAGGRTQVVVPHDGTFAVPLTANEVVDTIVPEVPDQDVTCRLDASYLGYACSGTSGPQVPPMSGFPTAPPAPAVVPTTPDPTAP